MAPMGSRRELLTVGVSGSTPETHREVLLRAAHCCQDLWVGQSKRHRGVLPMIEGRETAQPRREGISACTSCLSVSLDLCGLNSESSLVGLSPPSSGRHPTPCSGLPWGPAGHGRSILSDTLLGMTLSPGNSPGSDHTAISVGQSSWLGCWAGGQMVAQAPPPGVEE